MGNLENGLERKLENPLEQKCLENQKEAIQSTNDLIDQQIDWSLRKGNDFAQILANNLKEAYKRKADELTAEILRLEGEGKKIDTNLAVLQKSALGRLTLSASVNMGDVSTVNELPKVQEQIALMENVSILGLVHDLLPKPLAEEYERKLGRSVNPDTTKVLEKMESGRNLEDPDWSVIITYVHKINDKATVGPERAVGFALVEDLKPGQRMELLTRMSDDPLLPQILVDLVSGAYIKVDQADYFLSEKIKKLKADSKTVPEELARWEELRAKVSSGKVAEIQEKIEKARQAAPEYMSRATYGQRNSARELLTAKKLGSTLVMIDGGLTVAANVLIGLQDPLSIPTNPAFLMGMGMIGGGLEFSGGMGGLLPQPTKVLAKLSQDKDQSQKEEGKDKEKAFSDSLGRYPLEARLYYRLADKIVEAYKAQKELQTSTRPHLTLKDLGIQWDDLPIEYKNEAPEKIEKIVSEWAAVFFQDFALTNPGDEMGGQKWKMNQFRTQGKLPVYEDDEEVRKLLKPQP